MGAMGREKRQKGERNRCFLKDLSKAILVIFLADQVSGQKHTSGKYLKWLRVTSEVALLLVWH